MTVSNKFLPGNLVNARQRTWVVQNGSTEDWLKLRPLSGADDEVIELDPELEFDPVEPAVFAYPDPQQSGQYNSAKLLYDALRFQLRSGAGPFRSFASIAFEPRAYQLVPLMMALRMPVVRLLIADDVGIGKTIEGALIARELLDRGDIQSLAVLCPPHLVEQWVDELDRHFNIHAEALTSWSAPKLEKRVPHGKKLSDIFPFLVVSLDYIKSDRHREYFQTIAPEFLIVDEAHTCTKTTGAKQLRFDLLKRLASDPTRHMVLLTATPHSGNEEAFYNLLSLLDERFETLQGREVRSDDKLRLELAKHFIQRRRKDIVEWQQQSHERVDGFPVRQTTELTYKLDSAWLAFFEAVQSYCLGLINANDTTNNDTRHLIWYAVLALLRCVSSSPEAACVALRNRIERLGSATIADQIAYEVGDGDDDDTDTTDVTPGAQVEDSKALHALLAQAQKLTDPKHDPKFQLLVKHVENLLKEGFHPVVFCRYVATAEYVGRELAKAFPKVTVTTVTGTLVPDERRQRVEALGEHPSRILVATDCLSEGINLQQYFTSVIHYDLAWNPTRHEQREGRVDRFGQSAPEVRCSMIYGQDNPVDGFILNVILRKSQEIQKRLGVVVPVPEDTLHINEALIKATLFRRHEPLQTSLFDDPTIGALEEKWENALDKVKRTRTVFAQAAIHPDEVYGYWQREKEALGSHEDLEFFCREAAALLGCHLEPDPKKLSVYSVPVNTFKDKSLILRLEDAGIGHNSQLNFNELHRSSPFVSLLAESFIEEAMSQATESGISRCAVTESDALEAVSTAFLLRLRYQMFIRYRNELKRCLLAEEILPIAVSGVNRLEWKTGAEVLDLIHESRRANFSKEFAAKWVSKGIEHFRSHPEAIQQMVQSRAEELLKAHTSVKEYTVEGSVTEVNVCDPIDLMGVFVVLPAEE